VIHPQDRFKLSVDATCTSEKKGHFIARWAYYESDVQFNIAASESTVGGQDDNSNAFYVGNDEKLGFRSAANTIYALQAPPDLPNEFTIWQKCSGKLAAFKYRKGAEPIKTPTLLGWMREHQIVYLG
jgi:hypothetical protein